MLEAAIIVSQSMRLLTPTTWYGVMGRKEVECREESDDDDSR